MSFQLNLCQHVATAAEITHLDGFINGAERFWLDQTHSKLLRGTASPERMRHLQQVIDH